MEKVDFYDIEATEKEFIFQKISSQMGIPAFAVEKDWWVTKTLSIIFGMSIAEYLVFKGGTSLSKAWKLIQRFSEDVDLAIDRTFFGYTGKLSKKQLTALRKTAGLYSTGPFFEELQDRFLEKGFYGLKFNAVFAEDSDQDPRIIEIYYPNIIPAPEYVLPRVQIEIGCRSLREPYTVKTFGSLVDEAYPDNYFAAKLIDVPTVDTERTFLEKLFLLHEEFHRPLHKVRVNRLSRHLYDVYHLSKNGIADRAIKNRELYETIVAHRYEFSRLGGVNYNYHNPKVLDPLPPLEMMEAWKRDYKRMLDEMIFEWDAPTFEMLITNIEEIKEKLVEIEWDFSLEFPASNI